MKIFQDIVELSRAAAELVYSEAKQSVKRKNRFTVALSGGKTPQRLFECMAEPQYAAMFPWDRTHLFWGDERFVPPDHPDSNYGLVLRTLLDKVPLPEGNVHPVPTDESGPDLAAAAYEKQLKEFFRSEQCLPEFDLILLGIGADGHTASIFPGTPAVREMNKWVTAVMAPNGTNRISITLPVINRARKVCFLVAGEDKKTIVRDILKQPDNKQYPAAMVNPEGYLIWLLDRSAAALMD